MSTKRRPKRKVKVPIKFNDTVCDLTKIKSRNHVVISDEEVETERVEVLAVNGEGGDDTYCPSMEYKDYDTEFPLLNKKNDNNIEEVTEPEGTDCCVETGINDCCNNNCDDANKNDREMQSNRYKTFASMLRSNNDEIENKLNLIPLCVENGREDPDVVIDRSEPKTLPCWIKLHNVPLEACTSNGISAIASGLGKPLIMDKTTAKMCRGAISNFRYARVLVEIQADKEFKDKIEICYKNNDKRTKCSKFVKVEYSWKPPKCCECKVFGHTKNTCGLKSGIECNADKGVWNKKNDEEDNGFRKIRYGNKIIKLAAKMGNGLGQGKPQGTKVGKTSKENIEELRRSENKFSILEEMYDCEDPMEQLQIDKEIVNKFMMNQRHPTIEDSKNWTNEMFKYFKEQQETTWMNDCPDEEDVFDDETRISKTMTENELDEHSYDLLNKGSNNEIEDINCLRIHFTWVQSRHNPNSGILKKIDRVLGNVEFMSKFPNSHALFLPHLTSDHSPTVIEWKEKLQVIQKQVDQNPHNATLKMHEAKILKECNIARKDEEKLLLQKAKIDWLSDGDKNSKFFHSVLKGRAHKSRIETVNDENGIRYEGAQVAEKFVNHFQNFLGTASFMQNFNMGSLNSKAVCDEDAVKMIMNVSEEEIKNALFDICDNKAPGPDGYSAKFFKSAWSVIKNEAYDAIMEFFRTGRMIKSALCKLVSHCQSAFIPGRQITNNILLTQELLRGRRGLRQGDPISPYIFTLVMEVFTLILQKQISEDVKFKYHWGCKDLQISHLCFVDDLLVLCHGDLNSVKVVKRALDMFSSVSGLNPNIGKSIVFFGNVKEQDKQDILSILPLKIGSLPVSYLGVPLITKHLTFTDYKVLIDKVKIKVNDWT
ncbi:RNA-directed DNA polymerase, eukaryota, reverse transcriptase zinc-binding domain protein [Tanacetum coccineum]